MHFVAASSVLHSYLDSDPKNKSDVAKAYYLLGVTDSYIAMSKWVSETEFYLEQAIRLDPDGPDAVEAYYFLEQYMVKGFTGSAGTRMPEDVQANLDELRSLVGEG